MLRLRLPGRQGLAALLTFLACAGISSLILTAAPSGSLLAKVPASLAECKNDDDSNDFRCYATYYAAKSYAQGKEATFSDLKTAFETDQYVKAECHQITHIIGRTGYKKYGGLDKAYAQGDSFCWSGYYHGAIEQAINDIGGDKIASQAPVVCKSFADKRIYSFDHFNCVHGLGHGMMAVGAYDLPDSLELCDNLTSDWERSSCYGGVFMENVMVATRGDGTSAYFKDSEPLYPCTFVRTPYKEQCYLMQTSQVLQKNGYDFSATFQECTKADSAFVDTCYRSLGRDASGSTSSDRDRTIANCRLAPDANALHNCMLGAVRDFVSYHHSDVQAKDLCQAFGGDVTAPCLNDVKIYYQAF